MASDPTLRSLSMWVATKWTKIKNGDWGNGLYAIRDIPKGTFITDFPLEEKGQPFSSNSEAGNQDGVPFFVYSANSKTHLRLTRADQWNALGPRNKWSMGLFANHAAASSPLSNGVIVAHHYRAGSWKVRIKTTKRVLEGTEIRVPYNNYRWVRSWKPGSQFCDLIFPEPVLPPRPSVDVLPNGSSIISLTVFKTQGQKGLTTFNTQYSLPLITLLRSLSESPVIRETDTKIIIFYDDSIDDLPELIQSMTNLPHSPMFLKVFLGYPWRKGFQRSGHKGHLMTLARLSISSWEGISLALVRDINYAWSPLEEQALRDALLARKTQACHQNTIWRPTNYTEKRPNLSAFTFVSPPDTRLSLLLLNALKLEAFGGLCTLGSHLLKPDGALSGDQLVSTNQDDRLALAQTAHSLLKTEGTRLLHTAREEDSFHPYLRRLSNPPSNFTLNWLLNNIRPEQNSPPILPGGHWGCDEYVLALWSTWNRVSPVIPFHELTHPFEHSLDARCLPPPPALSPPNRTLSHAELNSLKAAHTRNEKKRKRIEKLRKARASKETK